MEISEVVWVIGLVLLFLTIAFFKNIVGGELHAYTELLGESRDEAIQRMLQEAIGRGANAVVNVRMATSAITPGASEILAYGTAVVVE